MAADVAALYIDPRGPYPKIPGVDCYDEERNAEMFPGGMPVVAHPPCGPWGRLRHLSKHDDPAAALHAVELVRECGGVLEHPAGSRLWGTLNLPKPGELPDEFGGVTVEVRQVDWGHPCSKPTWLYMVRVSAELESPPPGQPTHGIWYGRFERSGHAGPPLLGASKEKRRRTPPDFAAYLVRLARSVHGR